MRMFMSISSSVIVASVYDKKKTVWRHCIVSPPLPHLGHAGHIDSKMFEVFCEVRILDHIVLCIGIDVSSLRSDGAQLHSKGVLCFLVMFYGVIVTTRPYRGKGQWNKHFQSVARGGGCTHHTIEVFTSTQDSAISQVHPEIGRQITMDTLPATKRYQSHITTPAAPH